MEVWEEAFDKYGSDKPDIRFNMQLFDVTDIMRESNFTAFATEINKYAKEQSQPSAKALTVIIYLILQFLANKSIPSKSLVLEVFIAISSPGIFFSFM